MANESNLKPVRSKEEARERGRNGGKASGQKRRQKRDMRKAAELLMSLPVSDYNKTMLESIGIPEGEADNQMLMLAVAMQKACNGDLKAIQFFTNLTTISATEKAKLDLNKKWYELEAQKLAEDEVEVADDGFLDALNSAASKDWEDFKDEEPPKE